MPGIQRIANIRHNDIRYAHATDQQTAERLKTTLEQEQPLMFEQLIDLSQAGYKVPSGQFEVWLKD